MDIHSLLFDTSIFTNQRRKTMAEVNFKMLALAREARGLTQSELVKKIPNLSQGNYSRMEKGLLPIPDDTLFNISKELNFPLNFFTYNKPVKDQAEYYYRKRATMPRKHQIKLEANFDLVRIWIDTLLSDVDIPDFNLPLIEVDGNNNPSAIARKVRYFMSLPKGPIDKLVRSFEKHGIIVYFFKEAPDKFDGTTIITNTGQHIIVINDEFPNDRKRFTLAHELGHIVMHLPFSHTIDADRDTEDEANSFASEFLMPELDIRRDLINLKFRMLGDLKLYWKASKASLIRRAYDLKYIDKTKYTTMMIELSRMGERKQEKGHVDLDKPLLLKLIIDTYFDKLEYSKNDLSNILGISFEDFDHFLLGKDTNSTKLKIVI